MGVAGRLRRFAFARPAAFPVLGWGGGEVWRRCVARAPLRPSRAPHDADLLVLAGEIPPDWSEPLRALFETLALPRLAVWLRPPWDGPAPEGLPLIELDPGEGASGEVASALLDLDRANNRPVLEDRPPAPWRGVGDHGQGGEGMMGGRPYGRPMAMTGPDPDGLMLGEVPTALGPFFPGLPAGLEIELRMQGDRVRGCDEVRNRFPERPAAIAPVGSDISPALTAAFGGETTVGELERARLRSHLAWMADFLDLAGLGALGRRFLLCVGETDVRALRRLFAAAERAGLRRICRGLGPIDREMAGELGLVGPIARASGVAVDARSCDPAYATLGFEPVTETAGDAWARWEVRRRECLQSTGLIAVAGARATRAAEGPHGALARDEGGALRPPGRAGLDALKRVLPGLLWSEAVTVVASLDLDPAEAALR